MFPFDSVWYKYSTIGVEKHLFPEEEEEEGRE